MVFPKILSSATFINIDNKCFSWAVNQYIRLISEDHVITEDWSNDAENSALHHTNKLHCLYLLQLKTVIYIFTIIFRLFNRLPSKTYHTFLVCTYTFIIENIEIVIKWLTLHLLIWFGQEHKTTFWLLPSYPQITSYFIYDLNSESELSRILKGWAWNARGSCSPLCIFCWALYPPARAGCGCTLEVEDGWMHTGLVPA